MRPIALLLSGLLIILAGLGAYFIFFQPSPTGFVPADVPALLIVNRIPPSFTFLGRTRLAGLLDIESSELESRLDETLGGLDLEEIRKNVRRAWICIQGLEPKESGSFRINFSVVIQPAWFARSQLRDQIEGSVRQAFGTKAVQVRHQGETTIFEGAETGQLLYSGTRSGYLLLANNVEGWRDLELTQSGHQSSISELETFSRLTEKVDPDMDLFFYVSPDLLPGLLPGLAYAVTVEGEQVTESYAEAGE